MKMDNEKKEVTSMPDMTHTYLEKKYIHKTIPTEETIETIISFLNETFTTIPISPDEMNHLIFKLEFENCRSMAEGISDKDFEFVAFLIVKNRKSRAFYKSMDIEKFMLNKRKNYIDIIIEKKSGYINSSCHAVEILLQLKKGISKKDCIKKSSNYWAYLELMELANWEYSFEEQKVLGMFELLNT